MSSLLIGLEVKADFVAIEVFDLPQPYQRPSAASLLESMSLLRLPTPSFDKLEPSFLEKTDVDSEDAARYLTSIISSSLSWIDSEVDAEEVKVLASQILGEYAGRTARGSLNRKFPIPLPIGHSTSQSQVYSSSDVWTLEIQEPGLTGDNLGLKTWSSSYIVAERLHTVLGCYSTCVPSSKPLEVLEIGSGTGLLGLAAAGVLEAHVTLTDLPSILPNLQDNLAINKQAVHDVAPKARLSCGILDWKNPRTLELQPPIRNDDSQGTREQRFTIVLAADPIYSEEHPNLFTQTVLTWLTRSESARLLLAYPLRDSYSREFTMLRALLQEGGLEVLYEGEESGRDDWADDVLHSWSVWRWSRSESSH